MYRHVVLPTVLVIVVGDIVLGQPTLTYDHGKNCNADLVMECHFTVSFHPAQMRLWSYPTTTDIIIFDGISIDTNKYTENTSTSGSSYFTMTIKGITQSDATGNYVCEYITKSTAVTLEYECYDDTVDITRDSSSNMVTLTVDRVYPDLPTTILTVTLTNSAGTTIPGAVTSAPSTAYPGHFTLTWTSTYAVPDGTYTYNVVIQTNAAETPVTIADNLSVTVE